jgi:hypothetical protein
MANEFQVHTILNNDTVSNRGSLVTSFDEIQMINISEPGYFLQFDKMFPELKRMECDGVSTVEGDLIYRASVPKSTIVFDINQDGELIVIGANAKNYSITDEGDLIFGLTGSLERESDALFHDGYMGDTDKMYNKESALFNPK